jgi:hypothetical protein
VVAVADEVKFDFKDAAFFAAFDHLVKDMEAATITALEEAAKLLIAETGQSFTGPPGPTNRSGKLVGSVQATPVVKGFPEYSIQVGPQGVEYARRVELGKRGAHSAAPHPYLSPALKRVGNRFIDAFIKAWRGGEQ